MAINPDLLWHEVFWPQPLDREAALGLLRRFAVDLHRDSVAWEARGETGIVRYYVGARVEAHHRVAHLIHELVPGTTLVSVDGVPGHADEVARMRVSQPSLSLDVTTHELALRAHLAGLSAARSRGESTVVSVVIESGIAPAFVGTKPPDPTRSPARLLLLGAGPVSPEVRGSLRYKASQFRLRVAVRLGATAIESTRRANLMLGMLAGLRTMEAGGVRLNLSTDRPSAISHKTPWWQLPLALTVEELLIVLAWPVGDQPLPGQPALHPKQVRPGSTGDTSERDFATSTAPGPQLLLGVSTADSLYHSLFIGPTGSGKSTALLRLIVRDMEEGKSVVVIDPKADLISSILSRVPNHRAGDVVVLDPTHEAPVGLNPLAHTTDANKELVADGILAVFKDLFASSWGIRTSDVLHASILTLANHGHASLLWLPRLLTDATFRRSLTGALDDPIGLEAFWAQYEAMSAQQQSQVISPALSKLRQLLMRPSLRKVFGQVAPKFDLNDIFAQKRILLVPLNKGLIGPEAARLLGSLLVAQLWQLTLARAALPEAERHPVSVVVDEMQDYLHLPDLADALSQSRSLGVAWHLAHQYRDQLSDDLRSAVDANVRNTVAFGMEVADATALARKSTDLVAADFMALPRFHIYASLMVDGQKQPWVSGQTLPPPRNTSSASSIIVLSQRTYGQALSAKDLGSEKPSSSTKGDARRTSAHPEAGEQFGRRPKGSD